MDGSQWYPLPVTPIDGSSTVLQATAAGLWYVLVPGFAQVRCRLGGTVLGAVTVVGLCT